MREKSEEGGLSAALRFLISLGEEAEGVAPKSEEKAIIDFLKAPPPSVASDTKRKSPKVNTSFVWWLAL